MDTCLINFGNDQNMRYMHACNVFMEDYYAFSNKNLTPGYQLFVFLIFQHFQDSNFLFSLQTEEYIKNIIARILPVKWLKLKRLVDFCKARQLFSRCIH